MTTATFPIRTCCRSNFDQAYVDELKAQLPELPDEKKARFMRDYRPLGLRCRRAGRPSARPPNSSRRWRKGRDAKAAANWVINELTGRLNKEGKDIDASPVSAEQLGAILDLIADGTISGKIAKDLFEIVWSEGGDPRAIVEARGMKQVTDLGAIEKMVDEIIATNPDKAAQAKAKPAMIGWFVGQVMKASGGKANPQAVNDLLKTKLGLDPQRSATRAAMLRHSTRPRGGDRHAEQCGRLVKPIFVRCTRPRRRDLARSESPKPDFARFAID